MSVDLLLDIASGILIVAGSVFYVIGAIGLLRMPDVFTRMHAVSVSDTLGVGLLILGMILQAGFSFVTVKLLFILAIFFFTGPMATHALARGALAVGLKPVLFDKNRIPRTRPLALIGEFTTVQQVSSPASPAGLEEADQAAIDAPPPMRDEPGKDR